MRIVYLHGFASSPASSKAQLFRARFAALGQEMEIPELGADFEGLTLSGQLGVVERTVKGEAVSLIGSSMGGYLAALYAARHEEVENVVLMAPAFDFARRWSERLGEQETRRWRESGFLSVFHYGEDRVRRVGYGLLEDAMQYEAFPEVRQPALVFHGKKDDVVDPGLSEEFARRRPNATLRLLDSDHQLLDVTDLIWDETAKFLGY